MKKLFLFVLSFTVFLALYGCDSSNQEIRLNDFTTESKNLEADAVIVNVETFKHAYDLYEDDSVLFYIFSETHDITEVLKMTGVDCNLDQLNLKNQDYSLLGFFWMKGTNSILPHYVSEGYASDGIEIKENLKHDLEKYYDLLEDDLVNEVKNKQMNDLSSTREFLLSNEFFSHYIATIDTKQINDPIIDHGVEIISVMISREDIPESINLQVELVDTNVHDYYGQYDFAGIKYDSLTPNKIAGGIGNKHVNVSYQTEKNQEELMSTYLYIKAFDNEYGKLQSVNMNWDYQFMNSVDLKPVEVRFDVK